MPVRPLAEDDIPQVADLYWTVLRAHAGSPPPQVSSFLRELYFSNPWTDKTLSPLVYEEKGEIAGFLGLVARKMSYKGEPVRIAFGGNFAVYPKFRNTLAGLHLLKAYMSGGQDLSQTDSANDTSRALLERLGFTTILPYSVHWVRPLRPSRLTTFALTRLNDNSLSRIVDTVARPFCAVVDRLAARSAGPLRLIKPRLHASDLNVATLLDCLTRFRNGYSLWPEYDAHSLNWLLSFMTRMNGHGEGLRKLALWDDSGRIVGWYIFYLSPGGFAEVAQIGGEKNRIKEILDHLFHEAWTLGHIAAHGTTDLRLMDHFSEKNCFFTCRGGWTLAYARNPKFLDLLNAGDAFLSRLDGEWCLAFGNDKAARL